MHEELSKQYNPKESEDKWYKFWEEKNLFAARPNPAKKPFCIVIPPPNVTGILHMGHALNNTFQDILIRYQRLKGRESLWMPGTDHAGIATQNVVEKAMAKENFRRQDLGREKFIERVWQWREQYGSTIIKQLKKIGSSCDWQRLRFTMDEEYSRAVVEAFVRLYEKGLIYRGNYIINWCPRCQTALSDEEAPHHPLKGNLYYLKYPLQDAPRVFVSVATTRPETMLGDTAVAVNPKDKRYKKLINKFLILPLVNRKIKIIADSMVDMEFGTGAVKVTPAHDPNDYALGKKHNLEFVNCMHPDGRMNKNAGRYKDMDRFKARDAILADLQEKGFLEKIEQHELSVGHCYRCHTIIEPYLSQQWFIKMKPLAKPAIEAVRKAKIKFYPQRWTKVYLNWMENIQDWCISRQIWWGHRIPAWYCPECHPELKPYIYSEPKGGEIKDKLPDNPYHALKDNAMVRDLLKAIGPIVSKEKPNCPKCSNTVMVQDLDVLDTWFSSWLWPFATFYWPPEAQSAERRAQSEEDLRYFYPTSVLVTAPEIIFFWVARMIMAGLEFMHDIPFRDVYIHGTVRDIEGKKMSKSLGNIIDPLDIIQQYGADALRFSLISITAQGQDVYLSKERFEQGRNFANKIWNASRFILMHLDAPALSKGSLKKDALDIINRWILSRFYTTLKETGRLLESYRFNEAVNLLYGFFWHEFCDWYLEIIKNDIRKPDNQAVMRTVLEGFLRVLHPFMPFISEEVWQKLPHQGESIMASAWPEVQADLVDSKLEKQANFIFDVITQIRNLRSSIEIKPDQKVRVSVYSHDKAKQKLIQDNLSLILHLAKLEELVLLASARRPPATISGVAEDLDIYLHFTGLLDISLEQQKLKEKMNELGEALAAKKGRLGSPEFVKKAPTEVVEKEKESKAKMELELKRLEKMHNELLH